MLVKVYRTTILTNPLSEHLLVPEHVLIKSFRNGRNVSWLTERWSCQLFGMTPAKVDQPGYDAWNEDGFFSIRCISAQGVYLQKAICVGGGRKCKTQDVSDALTSVVGYVMVDIADFPVVTFILLPSDFIRSIFHSIRKTPKQMSREFIYRYFLSWGVDWEKSTIHPSFIMEQHGSSSTGVA